MQDKIVKLQTSDLIFFLGKNMIIFFKICLFISQHLIHQKKAKALIGNQRGVYSFVLPQQHTAFLHNIKIYGCRTGIKFDDSILIAEPNNYATKNVNA